MRMFERYITTFRTLLLGEEHFAIFFLDDVAQWYFANNRGHAQLRDDFPCLALPVTSTYMEFPAPQVVLAGNETNKTPSTARFFASIGTQVAINEKWGRRAIEDNWLEHFLVESMHISFGPLEKQQARDAYEGEDSGEPCRWMTFLTMHIDDRRKGHVILGGVAMYLNDRGQPIRPPRLFVNLPRDSSMSLNDYLFGVTQTHSVMSAYFNCFFFGLSLMHCKNVEIGERRLRPRGGRRRGHKGITYKVLNLKPFQTQVRHEYEGEGDETGRALHICRSHFRTYDDEKPLFGKYAGTFWVPAHVRGSADFGQIVKEYNVRT